MSVEVFGKETGYSAINQVNTGREVNSRLDSSSSPSDIARVMDEAIVTKSATSLGNMLTYENVLGDSSDTAVLMNHSFRFLTKTDLKTQFGEATGGSVDKEVPAEVFHWVKQRLIEKGYTQKWDATTGKMVENTYSSDEDILMGLGMYQYVNGLQTDFVIGQNTLRVLEEGGVQWKRPEDIYAQQQSTVAKIKQKEVAAEANTDFDEEKLYEALEKGYLEPNLTPTEQLTGRPQVESRMIDTKEVGKVNVSNKEMSIDAEVSPVEGVEMQPVSDELLREYFDSEMNSNIDFGALSDAQQRYGITWLNENADSISEIKITAKNPDANLLAQLSDLDVYECELVIGDVNDEVVAALESADIMDFTVTCDHIDADSLLQLMRHFGAKEGTLTLNLLGMAQQMRKLDNAIIAYTDAYKKLDNSRSIDFMRKNKAKSEMKRLKNDIQSLMPVRDEMYQILERLYTEYPKLGVKPNTAFYFTPTPTGTGGLDINSRALQGKWRVADYQDMDAEEFTVPDWFTPLEHNYILTNVVYGDSTDGPVYKQ